MRILIGAGRKNVQLLFFGGKKQTRFVLPWLSVIYEVAADSGQALR